MHTTPYLLRRPRNSYLNRALGLGDCQEPADKIF